MSIREGGIQMALDRDSRHAIGGRPRYALKKLPGEIAAFLDDVLGAALKQNLAYGVRIRRLPSCVAKVIRRLEGLCQRKMLLGDHSS